MQASTNTYWERVHLGELETAELLPPSQAYLTESWQNTKLTSYEKMYLQIDLPLPSLKKSVFS